MKAGNIIHKALLLAGLPFTAQARIGETSSLETVESTFTTTTSSTSRELQSVGCGCATCDQTVWNTMAGQYSCGARISWLDNHAGYSEADACRKVARDEFPSECGGCNPDTCSNTPPPPPCGCASCDESVWNTMAGQYSCGARISWLDNYQGYTEPDACRRVARDEYPTECGACNPDTCNISPTPSPTPAPTSSPTPAPTSSPTPAPTPAPTSSPTPAPTPSPTPAPTPAPTPSPTPSPTPPPTPGPTPPPSPCGCNSCNAVWDTESGEKPSEYTCGERISYLINHESHSEVDACRKVGAIEFPGLCGGCNPDTCDDKAFSDQAWTPIPFTATPYSAPAAPITDSGALYCFPDIQSRVRYANMWSSGYTVDVKEGNVCGPGSNRFTNSRVSAANSGSSLTLEFAYNSNTAVWEASEVRILRPNQEAFGYGKFEFSVLSTEVLDDTGAIVDTNLPQSLVLGLFTWDPTDDYSVHANWNHEVDVEVSRWNNAEHRDAQFLVQPPTQSLKSRFYTGSGETYDQSQKTYSFDWLPAKITWWSNTGNTLEISTEQSLFYQALGYNVPDYIQCLPANVEVRMNLWNTEGMTTVPNLPTTHSVRVVIDNFQFTPSTQTHVPVGGYCSKECHCDVANGKQCINGICT